MPSKPSKPSSDQEASPTQPVWERPQPMPSRNSAFYWEGAERGEFLGQRCAECKIFRHPPRPMCPECQCLSWEAVPLSGRGVIYAWMRPVHPKMPMFEDPLICILVDLEEGIRIFSNLYECEVSEVKNGMPVEVFFAKTAGDKAVPVFRPAQGTQSAASPNAASHAKGNA